LKQGYEPDRNSPWGDSWQFEVILRNPETGEYDIVLAPDVRFREGEGYSYSHLEFNSQEDPGQGVSSRFPLYQEISPDTETNIRNKVIEFTK